MNGNFARWDAKTATRCNLSGGHVVRSPKPVVARPIVYARMNLSSNRFDTWLI